MQTRETTPQDNTYHNTTHNVDQEIMRDLAAKLGGTVNQMERQGGAEQHSRQNSIQRMQVNRAQVLSYLLKLKRSIDSKHNDLVQAISQRFVEQLTDYISFSHFQWLPTSGAMTHQLVAIQNNTCVILDFTEAHTGNRTPALDTLKRQLEQLALTLEVRFEIEDEVVGYMR